MQQTLVSNLINELFYNPYNKNCNCDFIYNENKFYCTKCKKEICITNNILEFFTDSDLDVHKKNELIGNTVELTPETIENFKNKKSWNFYEPFWHNIKINKMVKIINKINPDTLAFLGCGSGFEIKEILEKVKVNRILASDISISFLSITPYTLQDFKNIELTLFTSDLDFCPIKDKNIPIIIYEAMHHTPDMHITIENLLKSGYKNIISTEPTNNFIVKYLAKKGLAQRIEYSGLKPGRLNLKTLTELAKKYNYNLEYETLWDIPIDYVNKLFPANSVSEKVFCYSMALFVNKLTNLFKFGNFTVFHLSKK